MPSPTNPIRVLLVASDPLARAGLAALLADQPTLNIVGQLAPAVDPAASLAVYQPDVLLWDLGWASSAVREALGPAAAWGKPLLALLPDPELAAEVWSAGVRGLLLREIETDALVAALTALVHGLVVIEPTLINFTTVTLASTPMPPVEALTPREREVLQRMAEGRANKNIARDLAISEHTVKFHVNAILGKLGAQSRTEAVVRATRMGLVLL